MPGAAAVFRGQHKLCDTLNPVHLPPRTPGHGASCPCCPQLLNATRLQCVHTSDVPATSTRFSPPRAACSCSDLLTSAIKYVYYFSLFLVAQHSQHSRGLGADFGLPPLPSPCPSDGTSCGPSAGELLVRKKASREKKNTNRKKQNPFFLIFYFLLFIFFNLENELEATSPESHKGSNGKSLFGVQSLSERQISAARLHGQDSCP